MSDNRFPKAQKLKHKTEIDLLFAKGKWRSVGNLRIISLDLLKKPQENIHVNAPKIGVSVSKKYFKKATDRNHIKRLLREVYRHNKTLFAENLGVHSISMIFWVSPEKPADLESLEENFRNLCRTKK